MRSNLIYENFDLKIIFQYDHESSCVNFCPKGPKTAGPTEKLFLFCIFSSFPSMFCTVRLDFDDVVPGLCDVAINRIKISKKYINQIKI